MLPLLSPLKGCGVTGAKSSLLDGRRPGYTLNESPAHRRIRLCHPTNRVYAAHTVKCRFQALYLSTCGTLILLW